MKSVLSRGSGNTRAWFWAAAGETAAAPATQAASSMPTPAPRVRTPLPELMVPPGSPETGVCQRVHGAQLFERPNLRRIGCPGRRISNASSTHPHARNLPSDGVLGSLTVQRDREELHLGWIL